MQDTKLDFWIKKNYNVLFEGKHGVGKTARIIAAFERAKLKWRYFSASTLDPWVDFVGVPKEVTDAQGRTYIDLIRPKCFADDDVEAIFLDEYNRSQPKVRNATMELVQFKSINGRKFNNLKIVWVAVNPDSDGENGEEITYDVEKLDPAQKDRFHVQVQVPYKPDPAFFRKEFGEEGVSAVTWWGELEAKEKELVSPRRLEYALRMYADGGDLRDILSVKINVSKLVNELKSGSFRKKMEEIFKSGDTAAGAEFICGENNYNSTWKYIAEDAEKVAFFFPVMPEEKQVILVSNNILAQNYAFENYDRFDRVIASAASDKKVQKRLATHIRTTSATAPLDVMKLTFASAATKLKKSPSGYSGYTSSNLTTMHASYSMFLDKGTTYRKQYFESLVMMITDNYISKGTTPSVAETKLCADALYKMINSTTDNTVMSAFYGFDAMFAYVHKLLKDAGEIAYLTNSGLKRVDDYVKANIMKFV